MYGDATGYDETRLSTYHTLISAKFYTLLSKSCNHGVCLKHFSGPWSDGILSHQSPKHLPLLLASGSMGNREVLLALGLGLPLLLFSLLYHYSRSLNSTKRGKARVPAGTFWQVPVFGETWQFLSGSADDFCLPRIKKYGKIFRTHLFGGPVICTTTMEAAKFILHSPELFELRMNEAIKVLMGREGVTNSQGDIHARYRRLILNPITSEAVKKFTAQVDRAAREQAREWGDKALLDTHDELRKFTFHVTLLFACDTLILDPETHAFRKSFQVLEDGFLAVPVNLPGSQYSKALKAREKALKFMYRLIEQRRDEKASVAHEDLLDSFINHEENGNKLSDQQIADNLLTVFFAGHDTSSIALAWVLHRLISYPDVLEQVKAENDALARGRQHVDDPITWDDLRKLPFTFKVIQETMRTANVVGFSMRDVKEDVVFDGMLFPKGWKVLVWYRYFHLDADLHPEPLKFNPSRFDTQPKTNSFLPFGTGPRVCPGMELAKQEMLIFLHRFVITYDFEPVGQLSHKVTHWPMPHPQGGLPLKITRRYLDS